MCHGLILAAEHGLKQSDYNEEVSRYYIVLLTMQNDVRVVDLSSYISFATPKHFCLLL